MRAREFITEQITLPLTDEISATLPATYVIPKLGNDDPYQQYRFGVAIARAKGEQGQKHHFSASSAWGKNQIVVSYSNTVDEYIDDALAIVGLTPKDKKLISTPNSHEPNTVNKVSPVSQWNKK